MKNGIVFQEKYGVLTPGLEQMLAKMMEYHMVDVCMESTSIYWMPVWKVLENHVSLKQVNPYFIKFSYHQVVVRKKNKMKVQVAIARKSPYGCLACDARQCCQSRLHP